jgi:hypothetical protein
MKYTTYDPVTGQIQATYTTQDDALPDYAVPGDYSSRTHYWDGQQMQIKPADPSAIVVYKFDYETKAWILDSEKSIKKLKDIRNEMLQVIDRINPVWYNSLSTQQQQELATYRQALLDVPQQPGFPESVEWPTKPQWL